MRFPVMEAVWALARVGLATTPAAAAMLVAACSVVVGAEHRWVCVAVVDMLEDVAAALVVAAAWRWAAVDRFAVTQLE